MSSWQVHCIFLTTRRNNPNFLPPFFHTQDYLITDVGLSRFHVTKNKIVQYWTYLYHSYVGYIGDWSRQVGNKHDTTHTTHTLHLHDRGNHIQRQAKFNTASTQTQTPTEDWWISWTLHSGILAIDQAGLPLHQRLHVQFWCVLDRFENVSHFMSELPNLRTLRYIRPRQIRPEKIGLLSNELQSFEDLSYDKLHCSPATWSCSQEAGLSKANIV